MTQENNYKAIEISKQKEDNVSTININEPAIDKVSEKMYQKTGIPVEKAKVILKFGIADAMMLNRFRSAFDKDVNEE